MVTQLSSWLYSVSIPVGVLLLAFFGRRFWQRRTKTSKPRFSREAGTSAHATLIRAKDIFQSKTGPGGGIHHPWKIKGVTVTEPEMKDALDAASAEIVDDDFRKFIKTIQKQLADVQKFAPTSNSRVYDPNHPERAYPADARQFDKENASRQRDAVKEGLDAASGAIDCLNKLRGNS